MNDPLLVILLDTARLYVESDKGSRVLVRALIDQCSQVSIVSQSLGQRLRLKYIRVDAPITGVGTGTAALSSETVSFTIYPRFQSDFLCKVDALVLARISVYSPTVVSSSSRLMHIEGLELADPNFMEAGNIDLLLGHPFTLRSLKVKLSRAS